MLVFTLPEFTPGAICTGTSMDSLEVTSSFETHIKAQSPGMQAMQLLMAQGRPGLDQDPPTTRPSVQC